MKLWVAGLSISTLFGCAEGLDDPSVPNEPTPWPQAVFPAEIGDLRRAAVHGPSDWDQEEPLPLVFLLHGYGANGLLQDLLFDFSLQVDGKQFLLVLPDGTENSQGTRFWNATQACCDFEGSGVDDVAYLLSLLDEAQERWNVDASRVYFSGHSNGGYMSYRMACDASDRIAAIAGLAGATPWDEADCGAEAVTSVLHIHGRLDEDVPYEGRTDVEWPSPGAYESASRWATRAGCDLDAAETLAPLDLWSDLGEDDTDVLQWSAGCSENRQVALWTMDEGGHIPIPDDAFAPAVLDWLFAHQLP